MQLTKATITKISYDSILIVIKSIFSNNCKKKIKAMGYETNKKMESAFYT